MYNIGFATQSQIIENCKNIYENVENIFSLLFPLGNNYTILWLFLCRVLCKWMLDHDESFRSSLLLCSLLCQFADLSSIYTTLLFIM